MLSTGTRYKSSASQTARFWSFGQEVCPWFLEEGSVNSDPRKRVGKQIKDFHSVHGPEKVPGDVFMLWGFIRDTLAHEQEEGLWLLRRP